MKPGVEGIFVRIVRNTKAKSRNPESLSFLLSFILSPLSFSRLILHPLKTPCQESAMSLEWLKFYSGDNYGLGWGPSLITSTRHEHVFIRVTNTAVLRFTITVVFRSTRPRRRPLAFLPALIIHPCFDAPHFSSPLSAGYSVKYQITTWEGPNIRPSTK